MKFDSEGLAIVFLNNFSLKLLQIFYNYLAFLERA
jgi:hypothetical protein